MTRAQLIQRIQSLSEDELSRVAPYLEADLDALADLAGLIEEIRLARESERTEPLLADEDVLRSVLERLG